MRVARPDGSYVYGPIDLGANPDLSVYGACITFCVCGHVIRRTGDDAGERAYADMEAHMATCPVAKKALSDVSADAEERP